jgi:[ribosomal protein S18]-alanine N-acetyltransferase
MVDGVPWIEWGGRVLSWLFGARRMSVEAARSADASALAGLHAQGFERAWDASAFDQLLTDGAVIGHVGRRRWGGPIGFVLSRKAADEAEILSIVVSRKARGRGVAAQLLGAHLSAVAQAGARRMFLEVDAGNAPALRLYQRFGFEEAGRRRSYYRKPDGSAADALIMARAL